MAATATAAGLFGLFRLPRLNTGAGSTQFACLLLSLRQFGFQPFYNGASLGGGFHGSLSHNTQKKDNRKRKEFYLNPRERYS